MAATFALYLNQAIKEGTVQANFKGVAFGDSWISPIDSTETWAQYLYALVSKSRDVIFLHVPESLNLLQTSNSLSLIPNKSKSVKFKLEKSGKL